MPCLRARDEAALSTLGQVGRSQEPDEMSKLKATLKWCACLAPAALFAWLVSPMLVAQGSSSAFDMAIGAPIGLLVMGVVYAATWSKT
jgi:hypothetical protein